MIVVAPHVKPLTKTRIWTSFREGVVYAWDLVPIRLLPLSLVLIR